MLATLGLVRLLAMMRGAPRAAISSDCGQLRTGIGAPGSQTAGPRVAIGSGHSRNGTGCTRHPVTFR